MNNGTLYSTITAVNLINGTAQGGSSDNNKDSYTGFTLFIVLLILFMGPMFIRWELPTKKYTIEMKLVTNEIVTQTFILPNDAEFYITNRQGTYLLAYSTNSRGIYFNLIGTSNIPVKYAVIDFKIKN
jgi:hypothetical protein